MKSLLPILFMLITVTGYSQQFTLDLDLRDRFEYRHGFSTLFPDDTEPAAFVRQRARLKLGYVSSLLEVKVSVQDVSTWGDTRQILPSDGNDSFMLFEAWAKIYFNELWAIQAGRQPISYDNQRILGGLDWAMQGRFHDALLIRFDNKSNKIDVGFAFNQVGEPTTGNEYDITGFFSYKTMQYIYLSKLWDKSTLSFLIMNNGFQAYEDPAQTITDGVYNRQTMGLYFSVPTGDFTFKGFGYYQSGKADQNTDLNAYDLGLEVAFKPNKSTFAAGVEILSGSDQGSTGDNNSFFPLYGTNHAFNGYMDYFYVGNHANNVGLNDYYVNATFKPGEKNSLKMAVHYFTSNAGFVAIDDKDLGTEIDLVYTHQIQKFVKAQIGYSHMFATDQMSIIKGGTTADNTNNWGWVQLFVNPNLFTYDLKKGEE
ncbi:alginate export family protein [Marinigracilibium pacificum]|uniref:Alginate export family protein n=1 Tax=Marinigracilibium pacificum TaxID=2729599 RepID=A0A848J4P6_9BACT|nr:alginate export family protein [Marinigracilibium pacificum]NMM50741.1 alginate export family protein [Marinigracilibium pacificum]